MTFPSRMSTRRFPRPLRLRLRIAYASAWESLIAIHAALALQCVHEIGVHLPALDALDLYFHVVPVPRRMREAVRNRALSEIRLALLPPPPPPPPLPEAGNGGSGWARLRGPLLRLRLRRRSRAMARLLARRAAARAADEILATHVTNVLNLTYLLAGHLSLDGAVVQYSREFAVPRPVAVLLRARVRVEAASAHLAERFLSPATSTLAGLVVGYPAPDSG